VAVHPASEHAGVSSPLIRTALMVRDLARSRAFYEAVVSLRGVYLDADLTATLSWKLLGAPPGTGLHAVILKPTEVAGRPAPDFGMLGLFQLADAPPPVPALPRAVRYGEPVLVFYVADLDAALAATVAHGGQVLSGPERFRLPDRGVDVAEAIVRDPDGVAVNLVQTPEYLAWSPTPP
jgi:catechol 2,3-dioxygenase-like lactoylglutathione lyase family enzyme